MATIKAKQLDTGTTANKVVALDSNAKLPAVAGDALTTLPALDTHSNVNAGSPSDGQVLTWVNASSEWQPQNAPSGGGSAPNVYTETATFTVGSGATDGAVGSSEIERIYLINNSATAVTVTLPAITGNVGAGFKLQIKRLGTANVTVSQNGTETIDSATSQVLSAQYSSFTLTNDGTNWYII